MMKVSVVIPLYNKEEFVMEALNSVLTQSFSDFEIIVLDDASTDRSYEIVEKLMHPKIKLFRNEVNLGTAKTGNRLMELASGEYIIRLDSDDKMCEDRIKNQVEFMDENPDIISSSGHLYCFGRFNEVWRQPLTHDEIWSKVLFKCPVIQGASIIRKSAWDKFNFKYDAQSKNLGEDWLLWFRMGMKGKLGNLDKNVIYYRLDENNITANRNDYYFESRKYLYTQMFTELGLPIEFVDVHILTKPEFNGVPSKNTVKRFFAWMKRLKEINDERGLFKKELFDAEIKSRKERLFYFLVDKRRSLFFLYLIFNRGVNMKQLKYFLSLLGK